MIENYNDFVRELMTAGFSAASPSGKAGRIFSLVPCSWTDTDFYDGPVRWHTGDTDTDPWQWKMRVLTERNDIAYGKTFFGSAGYITEKWYPCFMAARRHGETVAEAYENGRLSRTEKRICDTVAAYGRLRTDELKALGGFGREDGFERALTGLQMKTYLTICGHTRKRNRAGEEYGWDITIVTTPEDLFGEKISRAAANISPENAYEKIREQILKLNPGADDALIGKFIYNT